MQKTDRGKVGEETALKLGARWERDWVRVMGALFTVVLGLLGFGESSASGLTAERFFSAEQLAAYQWAQQGETQRLLEAVKAGQVDLNLPGREDLTLLGLAVLRADRRAIVSLMRAGADPNQVIPNAGSPAILAITRHFAPPRTEAVAALIEGGYDVNQLLSGAPYLVYFAKYNHWPGFWLALERGGNINARNSGGEPLISYLIEGGDYDQARALIEAGVDVAAKGQRGESALKAIDSDIRRGNPSVKKRWREMLELREMILSKLQNPEDRRSSFTDAAERKILENP